MKLSTDKIKSMMLQALFAQHMLSRYGDPDSKRYLELYDSLQNRKIEIIIKGGANDE